MNNRKLWAIAVAILLLGAGFALALPAIQAHGTKPAGKPGGRKDSPFAQLNLTAEQKQKMDQIRADFLAKTATLRADLEAKRTEFEALWFAKDLDENQILAKAAEIAKIQPQLSDYRLRQRIAMFKILTPEQRKLMLDSPHFKGGKGKYNHAARPAKAVD